jgi:hypothetical protein
MAVSGYVAGLVPMRRGRHGSCPGCSGMSRSASYPPTAGEGDKPLEDPDPCLRSPHRGRQEEWPLLVGPILGALGGAWLGHQYLGMDLVLIGVLGGATVGLFLGILWLRSRNRG